MFSRMRLAKSLFYALLFFFSKVSRMCNEFAPYFSAGKWKAKKSMTSLRFIVRSAFSLMLKAVAAFFPDLNSPDLCAHSEKSLTQYTCAHQRPPTAFRFSFVIVMSLFVCAWMGRWGGNRSLCENRNWRRSLGALGRKKSEMFAQQLGPRRRSLGRPVFLGPVQSA